MEIKSTQITQVDVNKLIPYDKNMNDHPPEQIDRLCDLIRYQGWRDPIIAQRGTNRIACGHGRVLAAKKLRMQTVPVIYEEFESEEQFYSFVVSHNAINEWSTLDLGKVNTEMLDMGPDFDIDLLGIKDFVLEPIEKFEPQSDEDSVPEPPVEPTTKRGDVWLLGGHRVMCGDSTMIDDVEKLMKGEKFDLLTDPPYGIDATRQTMGKSGKSLNRGATDWDGQIPDFQQNLELFEKKIIWGGNYFSDRLPVSNDWLCWHKKNDDRSFSEFELAWTNLGKNCRIKQHHWGGEKKLHVTMKPVAVMEWCLEYLSENIFDLFLGSGSTLIACEKTNRKCYGMELDEKYCDVIVKRWQEYTGKEATLESTGQKFNDLQKADNA